MIKRLARLKNTLNKYMADIRPERLTTCQSEREWVVTRQTSVLWHIHSISVSWVPSSALIIGDVSLRNYKASRQIWEQRADVSVSPL
jgi:hypothetical protein